MKRNPIKHKLDGIAALLLFAVFAVCILMVLLTGADAYRGLTQRDNVTHEERTCVQYIAQRVRQADRLDSIVLEEFEGVQSLVLGAGEEYITRLYCYDGSLMELYSAPEYGLCPEDGERIMDAQSLEMEMSGTMGGRLLTVTVTTAQGKQEEVVLGLRSGEGWSAQ